jgi:meso-butanediol dehydrogenase/(S,S)-butanediol dehydrogenase/diacetyl reductase
MSEDFNGRVALVTGSARGIGLAIATRLGELGATVVLSDILEQTLAESHGKLASQGIRALARGADISDAGECRALVDFAVEQAGKLDILVNNAGISIVSEFEQTRPEVCKKLMDVNVLGSIYVTHAALPHLKRSRGSVVFIASVSGVRAIPSGSIYSASKAALRSLAESLRLELKPHGVHVGVVSPGFTPTEAAKTVLRGDGTARPIHRPAHDTPEGVARQTVKLIARRQRERILTPLGKATSLLQRLSPSLVDAVLQGRELKN